MRDVTDMIQQYRLALRHIWNTHFYPDPAKRTWDSVTTFRTLQLPLYDALVAASLDQPPARRLFESRFEVVPDEYVVTLLVNQDSTDPHGVWKKTEFSGPPTLVLVDFFDWSPMDYIDLHYYLTRIESWPAHPEWNGHHALVEVAQARVLIATD